MALKDLLVHVDDDDACTTRIDVAVMLAARHEAHLTGLHVMAWPHLPGYIESQLPPAFHEERRHELDERARRAATRFHDGAHRGGLTPEWRTAEGDVLATVGLHARYADLTVLGQGVDLRDPSGELAWLPEELVLGVGRPVLIVPRYGTFPTVGERVLIAWNGSREATRAVNDALPVLRRAAAVTVLSIDAAGEPHRRVPGADIALHLARHGIRAEVTSTRSVELPVGDVLLSFAADCGADLLVMGAYGHSRLREMLLGGATRHLLQHMTVPVLMSH
jgi:nucleotide-binding universal stress UspA family protein